MKLNDEEMKLYYVKRGINAGDLLSTDDIHLSDLPPDVQLGEPNRTIAAHTIECWNRLDPLAKIDAALWTEERLLSRRRRSSILDIHIEAEAWCAYLMLGRIRGGEARRQVMEKIARGELTLTDVRQSQSGRKPRKPPTDAGRRDIAAFVAPNHARLRDAGNTRLRRETCETTETGDIVTVHHIHAVRPGARRSKR